MTPKTAVLAYSGGLDTSCAIAWLQEDYGFDEVVAVLVDVGQEFDVEESVARGEAAGAEVVVVDKVDAFAEEQVARALKTNALYEGRYPLVSALSRPVIAEAVASIACASALAAPGGVRMTTSGPAVSNERAHWRTAIASVRRRSGSVAPGGA